MAKPRHCALCDRELPRDHPTNTCRFCQAEEADHEYQRLRELEAEIISHSDPLVRQGFAAIVPVPELQGTAVCPQCHRAIWNVTSICHPRNPIFDCPFGLRNESHRHHFCACGQEVITIQIRLEAEHGTPGERA